MKLSDSERLMMLETRSQFCTLHYGGNYEDWLEAAKSNYPTDHPIWDVVYEMNTILALQPERLSEKTPKGEAIV